jgi:hypothetical protein
MSKYTEKVQQRVASINEAIKAGTVGDQEAAYIALLQARHAQAASNSKTSRREGRRKAGKTVKQIYGYSP